MTDNLLTFTRDFALSLVKSSEQFPVDFDGLWQWCGYTRKDSGKKLLDKNFELDFDFRLRNLAETREDGSFSHYRQEISLTLDAAKQFAMLAQTGQGKQVRRYFIEAEKELKSIKRIQPKTALELAKEQVKILEALELAQAQITLLEEDNQRQSEIIDELFDYSSIIRIAKYNNVSETNFNWRVLKAQSQLMLREVKIAPCPRYVTKNLYSHDVWRYCYPNFKIPETTTLVLHTV
ncbi:MAG: hypothetical protein ACRC80_13760 [Waterburya sp.]